MKESLPTLREVLAHPDVAPHVPQEELARIEEHFRTLATSSPDPLYIRILCGVGAWFAALFLVGFLGVSHLLSGGTSAIICGVILLAAAIAAVRMSARLFLGQLALALAFAGNIAVVAGVMDSYHLDLTALLVTHAVVCAVVYPLFPSATYRFTAPVFVGIIAAAVILDDKTMMGMHALVAVETLLAGALLLRERLPRALKPLSYAAACMLPGTLLFLNLHQAHSWRSDFQPALWPSSVLLACGLLYLLFRMAGDARRTREPWFAVACVSIVLLGIFTTPAILVAIGLLVIGFAHGDKALTALAYLFFPASLVVFYYALDVDLAYKSWVVAGSGVLALAARWAVARTRPKELGT